ncbi:hypothetical protein [Streptomyces sp. NPDC007000]|uniref:ATP-dependent DNA ligase n=1 Tax=Streptomyces sp. NPDC007000 TaxID=3155357 RepID=UPI00340AC886
MLTEARRELPPDGALPGEMIMEQKWDGFRAIVFAHPGHITIQSRNGADLTGVISRLCSVALRQSCAKKALLKRHMGLTRPATERRCPSSCAS